MYKSSQKFFLVFILTSAGFLLTSCHKKDSDSSAAPAGIIREPQPEEPLVTSTTTFSLNISNKGDGVGKVTSRPAGIDCGEEGTNCSKEFGSGQKLTLAAAPKDKYSEFTNWAGDCSGTEPCALTIDSNKSVEANFSLVRKTLTVTPRGSGTGLITSVLVPGINCGLDCSEQYPLDTEVILGIKQQTGYFTGWTGACSGFTNCQPSMTEDKNVEATFTQKKLARDWYGITSNGKEFFLGIENNRLLGFGYQCGATTTIYYFYSYTPGNQFVDYSIRTDNGSANFYGNIYSAYTAGGLITLDSSDGCESGTFSWEAISEDAPSSVSSARRMASKKRIPDQISGERPTKVIVQN